MSNKGDVIYVLHQHCVGRDGDNDSIELFATKESAENALQEAVEEYKKDFDNELDYIDVCKTGACIEADCNNNAYWNISEHTVQ